MIVSMVGEGAWKDALGQLEEWRPASQRVVIVSPHPDDETLGAGGLISRLSGRGIEVIVVAVTDGEHAYDDVLDLADLRREEQASALQVLGVPRKNIVRLGLTDSSVSKQQAELEQSLLPLVTAETLLVAPWTGDFHPDHEACGRAAANVVAHTGAKLASYIFWTWHRGTPVVLRGLNVQAFPLTPQDIALKAAALACHRSQLEHLSGAPILPSDLLWPMRLPYEVFVTA